MVKYRVIVKHQEKLPPENLVVYPIKSKTSLFNGIDDAIIFEIPTEDILCFDKSIVQTPEVISCKRIL